jgi:hypothetical protein
VPGTCAIPAPASNPRTPGDAVPHNPRFRILRPAKTQQKISGRLRSEQATRHRYAIRGYISTAAKPHISVFTALRDALTGNPWMPPIPATS